MTGVTALAAVVTITTTTTAAPAPATAQRFPDFGYLPPPSQYKGRVFKLSQSFPGRPPAADPALEHILAIDYTKDWRAYADAVRAYFFAGNVHGGPVSEDFRAEDNMIRRWYHVPWEHTGPAGREGIHGMTTEGIPPLKSMAPTQTDRWQTYAIGYWNPVGGWMLGQIWNPAKPNPAALAKSGWPEGTVVAKLLFTMAPVAQLPMLTNPVQWNGFVYSKPVDFGQKDLPPRVLQQVRLLQLDFMVKDSRAKATGGWVFGTFAYNGNLNRASAWDNLVPVGLSWGNDPAVKSMAAGNPEPTETLTNPDLQHVAINAADPDLPPQHLGFGLRLAGPADSPSSSCQSCHQTGEFPPTLAFQPPAGTAPGGPQWMQWFRDITAPAAFTPGAVSMDNSMENTIAMANYVQANGNLAGGLFDQQYQAGPPPHSLTMQRGRTIGQPE